MEPFLSFILGTASSVVASMITAMIKSASTSGSEAPSLQRADVEKEIVYVVLHSENQPHDIPTEAISERIMAEVDLISSRIPDLIVTRRGFELSKETIARLHSKNANIASTPTADRLALLQEVVAMRRAELLESSTRKVIDLEKTTRIEMPEQGSTALVTWKPAEPAQRRVADKLISKMMSRIDARRRES